MEWEYSWNSRRRLLAVIKSILDLQVGKASGSDASYTYVNTRAINFRGGLEINWIFNHCVWKSGTFCRLLQSVCWIDKTCRWQSGNYTWDGDRKTLKRILMTFLWRRLIWHSQQVNIDLQLGYGTLLVMDIARCWKVMVLVLILILK
jgi:hypothetical protein